MRILSIAATLLALQAAAVQAETITVQGTQTTGSSFLELLKFDPDAGQLTEVDLTLTGTVSGNVFRDDDRDGVRDPGEPGLANWEVRLVTGTTSVATTTDSSGHYVFSHVVAE